MNLSEIKRNEIWKGPKEKKIPPIIEQKIISYHLLLRCGETITFYSLKAAKEKVTLYQVQKGFKEYRFYKYEKPIKDATDRCTYMTKYTNQIWHADVHYLERNSIYLNAIIGNGIITEKTAKECLKILKQAIDN